MHRFGGRSFVTTNKRRVLLRLVPVVPPPPIHKATTSLGPFFYSTIAIRMSSSSSSTKKPVRPPHHAVLQSLGLLLPANNKPTKDDTETAISQNKVEVTATAILKHLLDTETLTEEAVRKAHEHIHHQALSAQKQASLKQKAKNFAVAIDTTVVVPPRTRHVALQIVYDGQDYTGLAENVGQVTDHSVERALFTAMRKCRFIPTMTDDNSKNQREGLQYSRCGRTDKGVSAAGQVIALRLKSSIPKDATWDEEGIQVVANHQLPKDSITPQTVWVVPPPHKRQTPKNKTNCDGNATTTTSSNTTTATRVRKQIREHAYDQVLNALLPPEIRIVGWTPVSEEFSARFSAGHRTYRYFFHRSPTLDITRMQQALRYIVGTCDFRNFCKLNVEQVSNFTRTIHGARIVPLSTTQSIQDDDSTSTTTTVLNASGENVWYVEIVGQAFLWHQIRCIVHVLFLVGQGKEDPDVVQRMLDVGQHPGKPSYPLADEKPLVLHDCVYANVQFGYTVRNLFSVRCHQETLWQEWSLKVARIFNSMLKMESDCLVQVGDVQAYVRERLTMRQKKARKGGGAAGSSVRPTIDVESIVAPYGTETRITWKQALDWMATLDLLPGPEGTRDFAHTPLLQRSKGTTYEQKVASLQNKRKSRFVENTQKKRQSKEADQAFYDHMSRQGGSAYDG